MRSVTTGSTLLLLLAFRATAQTTDAVNSFLSEAFSVYTEVTSILASDASNTASSTSSSTSSSSSSTTTTSSSSSPTSTSASPSSTRASSTSATAAAATTSAAHHGGGLSSTNLAIILGCVLGALALGLLVLVILLCCRRRRHSRAGSTRLLSPDGDEIETWRGPRHRPGSQDGLIGNNENHSSRTETGVPNMSEHPAFANERSHQNPFVPIPPAPRRSAPNSRVGLTDGAVPGQEPFVDNSDGMKKDHHHGGELAAGAGGVALGAAALHHHEKNKIRDNEYQGSYDHKPGFTRRPVPDAAYPTTTTNDDAYALNKVPSRKSGEATRPHNGDDYGYGTGPYEAAQRGIREPNTSAPLSPFNAAGHHRGASGDNGHPFMAAGAGAIGGAALMHHHNRDRSSSAPRRSYDSAKTPGPNALMDLSRQPLPMHETHPAHDMVSPISSDSYSSATGMQSGNHINTLSGSTAVSNTHHIPSEMPGDVPTPTSSSQRQSFGERPRSSGAPAAAALAHRRNQTPPNLPSRSPKRTRFSDDQDARLSSQRESDPSTNTSDDSTWRLSSGMPGAWGRNSSARRDSSPAANSEHLRNAGINPMGRAESPMRHSMPAGRSGPGATHGRRLRLADLKREEEERMEMERRGRMGSEWGGNSGYDGYQGQGVGQAM